MNISSSGVLFLCTAALPAGAYITMDLEWPTPTACGETMQLSASGRVIRSCPPHVAVQVLHHKFRLERRAETSDDAVGDTTVHPLVLVVDTASTYRRVSAMLSDRKYAVAHTTASGAMTILTTTPMRVAAVITNNVGPFAGIERIPLIVTGFTGPEENLSSASGLTFRLSKPLKRSDLLTVLGFSLPNPDTPERALEHNA